jgi:hypothetical protein
VLKQLTATWRLPPSDEIIRSRRLLQQYCHEEFEIGNRALARELDWPVSELVPPVADDELEPGELRDLNELWACQASDAERRLFFLSLQALIEQAGSNHDEESST